ncbi:MULTISPECIES: phosphatase PAP2 family protein [Achromobacter]|uniref:Phosphatase PAP2 family protein n=1 Tax=Achromobacter spanius TaxID=217203 RepID=A0ABY8GSK1_9BURK|nr:MULTISPECIES: phosphatase PAP2 family protein [Achromobacter]WAI82988.1 phosphatase PAP2 family protein [Achromobacter spanius]WEX93074.1 phosphatase PAP2 family protein [Achromobacter sp. SS2-2022]WFP07772.1 phosphatase PAP2 family protein [Achromobacter spanius]
MNDVYAEWVASHAMELFIALPVLTGAAALFVVRAYVGGSTVTRRVMVGAGVSAALLTFLVLAAAVHSQGRVVAFDGALANALSMSMDASLLWLLSWFTYLGDRTFLTVLGVAMTLYLLWTGWWRLAAFCAITTGLGGALNWVLKHTFERVRPEHDHGFVAATGWSFPSGHASAAMAVYGTACYLVWRLAPAPWRWPCVAGAAALIMAIGLSRILLQVHFASDVTAGFAVTLAWLAVCVAMAERYCGSRRAEEQL